MLSLGALEHIFTENTTLIGKVIWQVSFVANHVAAAESQRTCLLEVDGVLLSRCCTCRAHILADRLELLFQICSILIVLWHGGGLLFRIMQYLLINLVEFLHLRCPHGNTLTPRKELRPIRAQPHKPLVLPKQMRYLLRHRGHKALAS